MTITIKKEKRESSKNSFNLIIRFNMAIDQAVVQDKIKEYILAGITC